MKIFKKLISGKFNDSSEEINNDQIKTISKILSENLVDLFTIFNDTPDLIVRHLDIKKSNQKAVLVYLSSLIDKDTVHKHILYPLLNGDEDKKDPSQWVTIGDVKSTNSWTEIGNSLFQGNSVLLIDGEKDVMLFDTAGWPQRALEDPQLETSLKGAYLGFGESSDRNIALIRRYIPNRELKIKEMIVGRRSNSKVSLLYLEVVVQPEILQVLENRIQQINIDTILNVGELEEFIEDNPYACYNDIKNVI